MDQIHHQRRRLSEQIIIYYYQGINFRLKKINNREHYTKTEDLIVKFKKKKKKIY